MNLLKITLIAGVFALAGCSRDDDNGNPPLDMNLNVDSYTKVSVDGQVKVEFTRQDEPIPSQHFPVTIFATQQQRSKINVTSADGVLYITATDIRLSDNVIIKLTTADLEEVRLKRNQTAVFSGIEDDELVVATENNSKLDLTDFKIHNLINKTDGETQLSLESWNDEFVTAQTVSEQQAVLLNGTTLLVDNDYILTGENVALANGTWTVSGATVSKHFRMAHVDFITYGNTMIDARNAPSKSVKLNLDGQSEATVWAFNDIVGQGSGNSLLYYRPVIGVDLSGYIVDGGAQIAMLMSP